MISKDVPIDPSTQMPLIFFLGYIINRTFIKVADEKSFLGLASCAVPSHFEVKIASRLPCHRIILLLGGRAVPGYLC